MAKVFPEFGDLSIEVPIKDDRDYREDKVVTFENEAFRIWVQLSEGKAVNRLKEYKPHGFELMKREERARKFGVEGIWDESKLNSNTFMSEMVQPIKNSICKLISSVEGPNKYKVRNSAYRRYLLCN